MPIRREDMLRSGRRDDCCALVAIIMAILVPVANIVDVAVIARNAGAHQLTYRHTANVVFRNSFTWATAIGRTCGSFGRHERLCARPADWW